MAPRPGVDLDHHRHRHQRRAGRQSPTAACDRGGRNEHASTSLPTTPTSTTARRCSVYALAGARAGRASAFNADGSSTFDPGTELRLSRDGEQQIVTVTIPSTDEHGASAGVDAHHHRHRHQRRAGRHADSGVGRRGRAPSAVNVAANDTDVDDGARARRHAPARRRPARQRSTPTAARSRSTASSYRHLADGESRSVTITYTVDRRAWRASTLDPRRSPSPAPTTCRSPMPTAAPVDEDATITRQRR